MKKLLLATISFICLTATAQNVGIGTTTPNASSALEINSTNKGILIPRIGDTTGVPTPPEGLIIYNKNTKSLYFYNGSRWLAVGNVPNSTSTPTDRITYKVTGTGFTATEQELFSFQNGSSRSVSGTPGSGGTVGQINFTDLALTKVMDSNSVQILEAQMKGTLFSDVEIKFYATGSSSPYVSYKLKDAIISSYSVSGAAGGGPLVESITIAYGKFVFKDWVLNKVTGWNLATNTVYTTY